MHVTYTPINSYLSKLKKQTARKGRGSWNWFRSRMVSMSSRLLNQIQVPQKKYTLWYQCKTEFVKLCFKNVFHMRLHTNQFILFEIEGCSSWINFMRCGDLWETTDPKKRAKILLWVVIEPTLLKSDDIKTQNASFYDL